LFSVPPIGLGLPKPPAKGKSDAPTLNAAYLSSVGHPVTALVLEYRRLGKAASSYFEAYPKLLDNEGRLHPTFKQHGTVTGRLSCENPNLQQIPREATQEGMNVKKLFLPNDGYELWEFDYSNIELRMAAAYSRERSLVLAFREGADLHQRVADELGISRHEAKTCNFLLLYGGRANKLNSQINCGMKRAKEIVDKYLAQYPKLFALISQCENMASKRGYVKTWSGRKRHLQYQSEAWLAFNSLIQGGCGDVLRVSASDLVDQGYEVVNLVHDSVWVNIPVGEVPQQSEKIQSIMTDWTEPKFGVSFVTDKKRLN
jgi:DNA polymerase-1